mmetsp:Transcript_22094/g.53008  ORF Transcript_22094/g.53008 Transcript_22094/m.53008 type:complete len:239 (+) Transcript_22094:1463-2179(+)
MRDMELSEEQQSSIPSAAHTPCTLSVCIPSNTLNGPPDSAPLRCLTSAPSSPSPSLSEAESSTRPPMYFRAPGGKLTARSEVLFPPPPAPEVIPAADVCCADDTFSQTRTMLSALAAKTVFPSTVTIVNPPRAILSEVRGSVRVALRSQMYRHALFPAPKTFPAAISRPRRPASALQMRTHCPDLMSHIRTVASNDAEKRFSPATLRSVTPSVCPPYSRICAPESQSHCLIEQSSDPV